MERFGSHHERQESRGKAVWICGLKYKGRVGADAIEVSDRNLPQISPSRAIEDLARAEATVERRTEVAIANIAPPMDFEVVGIHVLAGDIPFDRAVGGIDFLLRDLRDLTKCLPRPARLVEI